MSEAMILEHAALTDTDFLIYTGDFCGYCRALKNLLEGHELSYVEYNFDPVSYTHLTLPTNREV